MAETPPCRKPLPGFTLFRDSVPVEVINELRFRAEFPNLADPRSPVMTLRVYDTRDPVPCIRTTSLFIGLLGKIETELLVEEDLQSCAWARKHGVPEPALNREAYFDYE